MRRFDEATTAHQRAIAICVEFGDHYGQAQALENLGQMHTELDDRERARRVWAEAVELFIAAGDADAAARIRQRIAGCKRKRWRWWRRRTW